MRSRCDKCKFWDSETGQSGHPDDKWGVCKRYPPVLDATWPAEAGDMNAGYSYIDYRHWNHPVTEGANWCGEHQRSNSSYTAYRQRRLLRKHDA